MSEKLYRWLLWLYPSRFRQAYGQEALQLFRDRARDETGFFARLRLWFDLLTDLSTSLPREYRYVETELVAAAARHRLDRLPSFYVLGNESPRRGALMLGSVLSLLAISAFWVSLSHPGNSVVIGKIVFGKLDSLGLSLQQPPPQEPPSATKRAPGEISRFDEAERKSVVDGAVANLKQYYVYPDVAQKMADALLAHEESGDDNGPMDGDSFARLLTSQLREVSHDRHLSVAFSRYPAPADASGPAPEDLARFRQDMERTNCTFEKVDMLPGNIGYVKFNMFPPPSVCREKAVAAMNRLQGSAAVIFDVRDNHGGSPDMVALIAGYLFDRPTHLNDIYDRPRNSTQQFWTESPVPGNKLADKPAYVLTSGSTFSGAEEFCYDLKMLKRATLVGETTGGGAHLTSPRRIDDHFTIFVPSGRPINPVSKTDWEGAGVEPDVKVIASDALETAQKLAAAHPHKN